MTESSSYRQAMKEASCNRPIRRKAWGASRFLIAAGGKQLLRQVRVDDLATGNAGVAVSPWTASAEDAQANDWQVCVLGKWQELRAGQGTCWTWPTDLLQALVQALASM
jgi:hypothetical protein